MIAAMEYRAATADDAGAIARLHADSWRIAYRGMLSDEYLDGPLYDDRLTVWTERMAHQGPHQFTLVADDAGALAGFAHTFTDESETWGSYVENLHAAPDRKGQGIGTRLMAETAAWVEANARLKSLYLFVLERNTNAQHFYDAVGGQQDGAEVRTGADGTQNNALRYVWRDLHLLSQLRPAPPPG
ncbi:MAG TPA: GNAT family N-acetyltransferase [Acidimicrobiales bacterium]|nr:GNAT family N-acetyltransferase [Acidimicrobiales bacterium]